MLVTEHSEDVEADLARYYPRTEDQLAAFLSGDMSIRRLHVLVSRLPRGSATGAARAGGRAHAEWTDQVELAAQLLEELRRLRLNFMQANTPETKQHTLPRDIEHVSRPQDDTSG
ncbi:hypothetical protein AB0I72_19165 [Nocardiopsis sp. NPDC049922]|uniref:hypothetical protein n=1 Tax=Nocardiopsis sp. NPDC049922 TaxID=3155157 RepID=UPI0033F3BF38